jgi:hypothetical protein
MNLINNNQPSNTLKRFVCVLAIVVLASFVRFMPFISTFSLFNFSPLNAIALFSGIYFANKWQSYLIPLTVIWLSDIAINYMYTSGITLFYTGFYWQYISYALIVWIGSSMKAKSTVFNTILAAMSGSLVFFILSNFGVWLGSGMYLHTFEGFVQCYTFAIPFFKNTILSDMAFSILLIALAQYIHKRYPSIGIA